VDRAQAHSQPVRLPTGAQQKESAVFVLVFVALALAVCTRLAVVVRHDRALTAPRSHTHELGPWGDRFRVI
jgi:hypothetical protein